MKVKKANKGFSPTKLTLAVAASLAAIGSAPATVQAQSAPTAAASDKLEEIMVTARRDSERLQDVPVSVQVVSGNTLEKMGLTSTDEISKLAPGLTMRNDGSSTTVVLRGVNWQPGSGTPATPIYFNEVPFDPGQSMASMYDMGQVEVLRGPQGTTRGAPSIAGAVTFTTKRPDLRKFGGFVQGSYGQAKHGDFQGAVNIPIINRELAVRLATNIENSEGNRIDSVNSSAKPSTHDRSYRATALWQPVDALSFQLMYQSRRTLTQYYDQVAGTGSPGHAAVTGGSPFIPANFNGPALSVGDRASVEDSRYYLDQHIDLLTFNSSWEVLGHQLSYNFGRQYNRSPVNFNSTDKLNMIPGFETTQANSFAGGLPLWKTNEIRLSSLPDPGQRFNYDIGWYNKKSGPPGNTHFNITQYLPGAFGNPLTDSPGTVTKPNPKYVLDVDYLSPIGQEFTSLYANTKIHITDRDELSVGLAKVTDRVPVGVNVTTGAATTAIVNPKLPSLAFCPLVAPGAKASTDYAGIVCELGIPAGSGNQNSSWNSSYSDLLYNFSLSHKYSDEVLAYFTSGTSFRTGLPAIGNVGLPANLTVPKPEKATSYELGVKTTIGDKLRINADVFQLDYKNQLTSFEGVQYWNGVTGKPTASNLAFYRNVDAQVRGIELNIAANPIRHLSLAADFSYSKIKSMGGSVPCNDPTQPAITATNVINYCTSAKGQVLNTQSPFQAVFNGAYDVPLDNAMSVYFRFNANYHGNNPNYGNFGSGTSFQSTPAYTVVDLFAGITGEKGSWDLGLYAKNAFDKQVELQRVALLNNVYGPYAAAPGGYDQVRTNLPREAGVKLRYAFGAK